MSALVAQNVQPEDPTDTGVVQTILVVDDSRAQRRVLGASLSRQGGYNVIEAASGEDALALLQSEDIDLILSDWMMPGMDGLELCQQFRAMEREKYGYFILLTSKTEKGAVAQGGLDVGADDFLSKPPPMPKNCVHGSMRATGSCACSANCRKRTGWSVRRWRKFRRSMTIWIAT